MSTKAAAADDPSKDLERLYPESVVVRGVRTTDPAEAPRDVRAHPLSIKQLQTVGVILRRVADAHDTLGFALILTEHTDDIVEAVSVATGEDASWLGRVLHPDFAALVRACIKANVESLKARFPELAAGIEGHLAGGGGVGLMFTFFSTSPVSPTPEPSPQEPPAS